MWPFWPSRKGMRSGKIGCLHGAKPLRLFFLLVLAGTAIASSVVAEDLAPTWIFFSDKGEALNQQQTLATTAAHLTPRARWRRAKVMPSHQLVDMTDVAVCPEYIRELTSRGMQVRAVSKWLNAVSVSASVEQLASTARLGFVVRQRPVLTFARAPLQFYAQLEKASSPFALDYGPSLTQNTLMKVPEVHARGISGQGVLIAVFDTGFRLNHEAFNHLRVKGQYDFIGKDGDTDLEPEDNSSQISHGTMVLSVLGGYASGKLIGPAFSSDFLLAKTEDTSSEKPIEEDYWVAAAEWADSLGADIISSSLGYMDWYEYQDMDGNTAPVTRAADLAVKKGILVLVAAGNEGNQPWLHIMAPADGDSVIAVGAIASSGSIAPFSSRGPSFDNRIKPDMVAMGMGVRCIAVPPQANGVTSGYSVVDGTSAATPLAAGAAALLLSSHPQLTPMQVREALMMTADRAANPDNTYGYGLIDVLAALDYCEDLESLPEQSALLSCYPNPFSPKEQIQLKIIADLAEDATVELQVYNLLGEKVAVIKQGFYSAGKNKRWSWDGTNSRGGRMAAGVYLLRMRIGSTQITRKFTLLH